MAAIDPVTRKLIWERFERDQPSPGPSLNDWVVGLSEESGVAAVVVRRVVSEGSALVLQTINDKALTLAQEIAERMGASLSAAFEVLREAYSATKKKVLLDKGGRPKLIDVREDGPGFVPENMIYVEVPDWQSRLSAVRTTIEIFGARAPQQFEINSRTVNLDLNPKDAIEELRRLSGEIPRLQRAYAAIAEGSASDAGAGETIESTPLN